MTSAFWRGRGPAPGTPIWMKNEIRGTSSGGLKVLRNGERIFDWRAWREARLRADRLGWMQNLYRSPDVLQHAQKAAQGTPEPISWSADPLSWTDDVYLRQAKATSWEKAPPQEIIDQIAWYRRAAENGTWTMPVFPPAY